MYSFNFLRKLSVDKNILAITQAFTEFLSSDYGDSGYCRVISKLIISEEKRLLVSLDKVQKAMDVKYHTGLLTEPGLYLEALVWAVNEVAKQIASEDILPPVLPEDLYFAVLTGSFGAHHGLVGGLKN